jgi:hypothetical protein
METAFIRNVVWGTDIFVIWFFFVAVNPSLVLIFMHFRTKRILN